MAERTRGWWYPLILMGALGVAMAVNGLMAYFATSTFTGLSTEDAYARGVTYNQTLDAARQQGNLKWKVTAQFIPAANGHAGEVAFTYLDKDGMPIKGLDVQALIDRPNVTGTEQRLTLAEKGNGVYAAKISLPQAGQWDFDVLAFAPDTTYQLQRRFVVP